MGTNMVVEYKSFLMEIDTKVCTQTENQKVMAFIAGKMEPYIKDNLKMVSGMDMGHGRLEVKDMKGIISMIKEMAKECINGGQKAITKDNF